MHLTVFKTYAKELNLLQCSESDLEQGRRVVQVLKDGLQLFMGSSGDEALRNNWKMYCHLLQAYSAYLQCTVALLKKKTQIENDVVLELIACSEIVFCTARCEGLKSKLTEAQLNNIYAGIVEGVLSVVFEADAQSAHTSVTQQKIRAAFDRFLTAALRGNVPICTYFSSMLNSVIRYARVKASAKVLVCAATERMFAFLQANSKQAPTEPPTTGRSKQKPAPACPAPSQPHGSEYRCSDTELCSAALLVLECAVSADMGCSAEDLDTMWSTMLSLCKTSDTSAIVPLVAELAGALSGGIQTMTAIADRVQDACAQYVRADGTAAAQPVPLPVLELICSVPLFATVQYTSRPAVEAGEGVNLLFTKLAKSLVAVCTAAPAQDDGTFASIHQQQLTAMPGFLCRALSHSATVLAAALKADKSVHSYAALRFLVSAGELLLPSHHSRPPVEPAMLVRTVRSAYALLAQVEAKSISASVIQSAGEVLIRLLLVVRSCTPALPTGDIGSICVIFARCCVLPVVPAMSLSVEVVVEESSALEGVVGVLSLCVSLLAGGSETAPGGAPGGVSGGPTKDLLPALSKALASLVLRRSLQVPISSKGAEGEVGARSAALLSCLDCLLPHPKIAALLLASFNCKIVHAAVSTEATVCVDTLIQIIVAVNTHLSSADVSSLVWHLKSHLHFSGQCILSSSDQDAIRAQIREKLSVLDPAEYETALLVPANSNNKITGKPKKSALETADLSQQDAAVQLLKCSEALRCWCLLCAWTDHSAVQLHVTDSQRGGNGNVGDAAGDSPRDRDHDAAAGELCCGKYVTALVKLLKRLLLLLSTEQLSNISGADDKAAAYCAVSEVFALYCRPLMAQLHVHGRTEDQVLLLRVAKALEIHTQGEHPDVVAAAQDLHTFTNTALVFSGVSTKAERTALLFNYCPQQDTRTPAARCPQSSVVDQLALACIALLQPENSQIVELYAKTYGPEASLPTSRAEFTALVKQAYSFAGSHRKKRCFDVIEATDFTPVICAVCCKVLFLCFQDLAGSLEWGGYACSGASPQSRSATSGASPWLGTNTLIAQVAVLEALLVRADVYEVLGNVDSALAYAKEAAALSSSLHSPALQNIVSLHTLRLYHRTASPRLCSLVSDLLEHTEQIYSSEAVRSDITSKQVRGAAASIAEHFSLGPEDMQDCKASSGNTEAVKYRHMHLYWDMTNTGDAIKTRAPYNCPLPLSDRAALRAVLDAAAPIQQSQLSGVSLSSSDADVCSALTLLTRLEATSAPVDVVRDLRRRSCALSLSTARAGAAVGPLVTFLAGASSCGVAIDRLLDNHQDAAESLGTVDRGPFSSISRAADTVHNALLGDADCARLVLDKLQPMLQRSAPDGGGYSVLAFACLEPASGALLLGRMDSGGSLVVALPVHQDLQRLLTRWDDAQEQSRAMLRQGINVEQVAALTDKQKKGWWSARQQHDAGVEVMLSDLQDLLGPWRVLLSAAPVQEELFERVSAVAQKYFTVEKNVAEFVKWACLLLSNTSSARDVAVRTMPLSTKEANDGLSALLSEVSPQMSEAQRASLTQDLMATVATMRATACSSPVSPQSHTASSCTTDQASSVAFTCESLNSLKVTELRSLLKDHGLDGAGKKQDLVDRMLEHQSKIQVQSPSAQAAATSTSPAADKVTGPDTSAGHLVLILDEQLQRLPFESMPALRQASCSRVPSLPLLLRLLDAARVDLDMMGDDDQVCRGISTMKLSTADNAKPAKDAKKSTASSKKPATAAAAAKKRTSPGQSQSAEKENASPQANPSTGQLWRDVAVDKCWYALDIENNLPNTRSTLQPFLSPYEEKWHWQSVVANIPSETRTKELHEASELFIFCGHGAGERMCDPFRFRRLRACPAAMLWGCSSGRLKAAGVHDALGTAVYYLLAGAPFVVANLWDVTDKDIDKLCMTHMQLCFDGSVTEGSSGKDTGEVCNVSTALARSRNVCRMQFAVGAAPVVYGIPAYVGQGGKGSV